MMNYAVSHHLLLCRRRLVYICRYIYVYLLVIGRNFLKFHRIKHRNSNGRYIGIIYSFDLKRNIRVYSKITELVTIWQTFMK